MNNHPWLMEQLTASRLDDVRRQVFADQLAKAATSPRAGWSRRLGGVLIRVGQRLAGPEANRRPVAGAAAGAGAGAGC